MNQTEIRWTVQIQYPDGSRLLKETPTWATQSDLDGEMILATAVQFAQEVQGLHAVARSGCEINRVREQQRATTQEPAV